MSKKTCAMLDTNIRNKHPDKISVNHNMLFQDKILVFHQQLTNLILDIHHQWAFSKIILIKDHLNLFCISYKKIPEIFIKSTWDWNKPNFLEFNLTQQVFLIISNVYRILSMEHCIWSEEAITKVMQKLFTPFMKYK